ncbi:family 20 glycosylhydrolase [Chitinophaga barathri]|uniref:Uncharacterized protein n=1 Tax=Chitinophaga barathri TaxID=1647451 RepID=A0A3N4N0G3_9BACT|nr:family 20 glycosylhydrolase [Chitinophaga barathri]RPD41113.1 hypothetical protein EG028_10530 [Chitinophaga barathri]
MKQLLFAGILCIPYAAYSQNLKDTLQLRQDIKVAVQPGQRQLSLPQPYPDYRLLLKGTDRLPVVDTTGAITVPLQETTVQLYLIAEKKSDGALTELPNIAVTIPGSRPAKGNAQPFVIPSLREWAGDSGYYQVRKTSSIVIDPAYKNELEKAAQLTSEDFKRTNQHGFQVRTGKPDRGDIYLTLQSADKSLGKEGYRLNIGEYIRVEANQYQGLFAGTRTVLQLFAQDSTGGLRIPKGEARDYPKYEVRGFMLDAGRKYFSMEFVRQYVRFMSYFKMNDFHIHLNDNGFKKFFNDNWDSTYSAFRLENDTYPGLSAKDGFWTKKEFIELQQMARDYGIRIIPEIDVPAHSLSIAKAVPAVGSKQYGMDHLDLNNPETYTVVENIFKEYLSGPNPVFTGDEVHIGTDEYAKKEAEAFRRFTDHFIRYAEGFGKKVRFWGSLTHAKGETPVRNKGVTINAWYNGYADPKEMIAEGYDLISTPDGWLYIVPAAGYYYDFLNNNRLYRQWEPIRIGNQTFAYGHPKIRGGSFAVWNDHSGNGITEYDVHYRVFGSMQTLAEKMWSGANSSVPFETFIKKGSTLLPAPGLLFGKIPSKDSLALYYKFNDLKNSAQDNFHLEKGENATASKNILHLNGGKSYVTSPLKGMGYDYTVEFEIMPQGPQQPGAVLFSSDYAVVKLTQEGTDKLGFSREGINYNFNYTVPEGRWTKIRITGDAYGTTLYVDGQKQDDLRGQFYTFTNTKDKMAKVQTLYFPLQRIGDTKNAFKGQIKELKVYNVKWKD